MPIAITVPRLGWSMEEGTFSAWLKQHGESVEPGEMLFAIESDKVTMDVEALDGGVLYVPADAPQPGERVVPGQLLGYLLAAGEAAPDGRVAVTPRARRVARELDVDLKSLQGTGKGGRIRERDVRGAAPKKPQQPVAQPLRRTIAARMMRSTQNTAPVTLMRRVDATSMAAMREQDKQISYTAIMVKLAAQALEQHPLLASRWEDDSIVAPSGTHIGIAVDTEHGLIVPVIRDADQLSITQIAARLRQLVQAAHARQLKPEDVDGGVFTITNLGAYGVEAFTPILNYPETAVLGMGAVQWEPVALGNGHLVTRQQITLSLTFDHRVLDGAPAARFLQTLAEVMTTALRSGPHA
ncbi:MAG: 2-oxo acid dehydrogenase subunit E2 [Acidobacteria bacterium]|nr:2-oxo acid dehydrogenase subunit E2 [Acidobacteriota bacterium]